MTRDEAIAQREQERTNSEFIWMTQLRPDFETALRRGLLTPDDILKRIDQDHGHLMDFMRMYHDEEIKRLYPAGAS